MQCPKCSGPLEEVDLMEENPECVEYYVACEYEGCTEYYDDVTECFKCDKCNTYIYIGGAILV